MTAQELIRALVNMSNQNAEVMVNNRDINTINENENCINIMLSDDHEHVLSIEDKYKSLTPTIRGNICDILENFNFSKVHQYMEATNWKWFGEGVPSQYVLSHKAREMLIEACYNSFTAIDDEYEHCTIETGGFFVRAWDKGNNVELRFSIETYGNV